MQNYVHLQNKKGAVSAHQWFNHQIIGDSSQNLTLPVGYVQ